MRRNRFLNFAAALCVAVAFTWLPAAARAQSESPAGAADDGGAARIVAQFIERETAFQRDFTRYNFQREAVIQGIGKGGQVTGEYHRLSRLSFDEQGHLIERVVKMPTPTLTPSQTDLEDLNSIQLFVLEAAKLPQYEFKFVGREHIDEINTYVFDVAPRVMPNPKKSKERYFQGRVWIDDQDFQLVKAKGKGVPEGKEVFPTFVYYREHDGHYWVPSRINADDELVEPKTGAVFRIRMRVTYTDHATSRAAQAKFE